MESNHRKAMPGAGWGRVIFQPAYNDLLLVNINPGQIVIYIDFVALIIDAVSYAAVRAKQRLTNHWRAIPGIGPCGSIIAIKPMFAIT